MGMEDFNCSPMVAPPRSPTSPEAATPDPSPLIIPSPPANWRHDETTQSPQMGDFNFSPIRSSSSSSPNDAAIDSSPMEFNFDIRFVFLRPRNPALLRLVASRMWISSLPGEGLVVAGFVGLEFEGVSKILRILDHSRSGTNKKNLQFLIEWNDYSGDTQWLQLDDLRNARNLGPVDWRAAAAKARQKSKEYWG
ncbi:hypothetical protein FN846DRAFT_907858 [Sphaerosporella brunnea]|uniref:Chromo domain-containing protein n=1 Tax=Sphaerosporella brunnea TaxID=1250544 RepID=A0A5J5EW27_9PEZI|nr:hypothetical protein FN846DRAFT_907858 [Sphaerosporella brunnea]